MTDHKLCEARVYNPRAALYLSCFNRARFGVYCGKHSPERKAARRAKRLAERLAERRITRLRKAAQAVLDAAVMVTGEGWCIADDDALDELTDALAASKRGGRK